MVTVPMDIVMRRSKKNSYNGFFAEPISLLINYKLCQPQQSRILQKHLLPPIESPDQKQLSAAFSKKA